jgi:hypothetical protein
MAYPKRGAWTFHNVDRDFLFYPTIDSILISQEHPDSTATLACDVEDTAQALWFAVEDKCVVAFDGERIWAGHLKTVTEDRLEETAGRLWKLEGQDFTAKLSDAIIRRRHKRKREKAVRRVRWILSYMRPNIFALAGKDLSHIPDTKVEAYDYFGATVAEALQHVADELRLHFFVDFDKVFRMYRSENVDAPFDLDNEAPDLVASFPFREWDYATDSVDLANAILVEPEKRKHSRWSASPDSILLYGRQERFVSDGNLDGVNQALATGQRTLALADRPEVEGHLLTYQPGIWAGMTVHIREALWEHDFSRFVRSVEIHAVDPHDEAGEAYLASYLTVTDQRRPKLRGRGGQGHRGSINKNTRRRPGQDADTTPYPFDDFGRTVDPPTVTDGVSFSASVTRYTVRRGRYGMVIHYAPGVGYVYDGLGAEWGPEILASPSGTPYIESNAGVDNQPWTTTPGTFGCGIGGGSWSGWREAEVWYRIEVPTVPADMAGMYLSFTLGAGSVAATSAAIRVLDSEPTDTRQGTVIGHALPGVTTEVLVPGGSIPAAGGYVWVGLSPDWQADYDFGVSCSSGFSNPLATGEHNSGRITGPTAPSASLWAVYSASGDGPGTTDPPGKAPWDGPHTWHEMTEGSVVWSMDGDALVVAAEEPGGFGMYVLGQREDPEQPDGPWSDVMWAVEVDFKVSADGDTGTAGPRHIELTTTGEGERTVGTIYLGDSSHAEGIGVAGPTSSDYFAKAITNDEKWRAIFDSRSGLMKGKLFRLADGEPAAWDTQCVMDETEDEGDRFAIWVRTGNGAGDAMTVKVTKMLVQVGAHDGQRVVREHLGLASGVTNVFYTNHPFQRGSLKAFVNGVAVAPTEEDGGACRFKLDFYPTAGMVIRATYTCDYPDPVEAEPEEPPVVVPDFAFVGSPSAVPSTSGATISWATTLPSTAMVEYGPTTSYGSSTATDELGDTAHTQSIAGLDDDTTYHYRVVSTDEGGRTILSSDQTFTTVDIPAVEPPPESEGITYVDYTVPGDITTISALRSWVNANVPDGTDMTHHSRVLLGAGRTYTGSAGYDFKGRRYLTFDGEGTETTRNQTGGAIVRVTSSWGGGMTASTFYARSLTAQASATGIRFVRMGIEGNSTDYATTNAGKNGEDQHGIAAFGVDDLEVRHCTFDKNHGDGVVLRSSNPSNASATHPSMRAYIHDSTIKRNGRMGVAVIHAGDTRVENVDFEDIAMKPIDVEPNQDHEGIFGTTLFQRLTFTGHYSWNDQFSDPPIGINGHGKIQGVVYITDIVNDAVSTAPHSGIGFVKASSEKAPMVKTATMYIEDNSNTAGGRPAPAVTLANWRGTVYVRDNTGLVSSGSPYVSATNCTSVIQSGNT